MRRPPGAGRDRGRSGTLVLGLACLLVGVVYAFSSPGTYQDDDVDRYYMARQVWSDPTLLLDRWGMPLPVLLFAAPARIAGYGGVEVTTALISAAAALGAGLAAGAAGFAFPWLAVLLTFFQPLFLELSYSALAEPVAALLVAGVLRAWYGGRWTQAVLLSGLLPLARIDTGVLTAVTLALAWPRVGWRVRLGCWVPLLLWNLAGFAKTGEPLFVLGMGVDRPLLSLGALHYLHNGIVVVGPVVLFLFLWALAARTQTGSDRSSEPVGFPAFAALLAGVHVLVLTLLAWDALPFGRSVGFLRHLTATAPAFALVALWGAEDWLGPARRPRAARVVFALVWTFVTARFLSHQLVGHSFVGPGRVEWRWLVTAAMAVLGVTLLWFSSRRGRRGLAIGLGAAAAVVTLATVRPIGLDPERQAIRTVVEQLERWGLSGAVVHTNHPWFAFLSGRDRYDLVRTPHLTRSALETASPGSLVLWENHYGDRLWGDVPLAALRGDARFERMLELTAGSNRSFKVVVFRRRQ